MSNHARSAAIYGALLLGLMGVSWFRWTSEPDVELDGKVVLLQGDQDGLEKVVWHAKDKDRAVIERRSDDHGSYLWVSYTKWVEEKPVTPMDPDAEPTPEPDEDAEPSEEDTPKSYREEHQVFKAGKAGDELLESLSPMLAEAPDAAEDEHGDGQSEHTLGAEDAAVQAVRAGEPGSGRVLRTKSAVSGVGASAGYRGSSSLIMVTV